MATATPSTKVSRPVTRLVAMPSVNHADASPTRPFQWARARSRKADEATTSAAAPTSRGVVSAASAGNRTE